MTSSMIWVEYCCHSVKNLNSLDIFEDFLIFFWRLYEDFSRLFEDFWRLLKILEDFWRNYNTLKTFEDFCSGWESTSLDYWMVRRIFMFSIIWFGHKIIMLGKKQPGSITNIYTYICAQNPHNPLALNFSHKLKSTQSTLNFSQK